MEQLSGDELAARVYERQKFMVLWSLRPLKAGQITDSQGDATFPLRVLGDSSRAEYLAQCTLASRLSGINLIPTYELSGHYYRVEVAD